MTRSCQPHFRAAWSDTPDGSSPSSSRSPSERSDEAACPVKQVDRHPASMFGARRASPAILPTQTERVQRSSTRKRHRLDIELSRCSRLNLYPDALIPQHLDARSSVGPTIPVMLMDGLPAHHQCMRASRSRGLRHSSGVALPLFGKGIYGILLTRNISCAS